MSPPCPTCCDSCSAGKIALKKLNRSQKVLPVGSLLIQLELATDLQHLGKFCDHTHAPDGWHYFAPDSDITPPFSNQDDSKEAFFWVIESLITKKYIIATYRFKRGEAVVRIYAVLEKFQLPTSIAPPTRREQGRQKILINRNLDLSNFGKIMRMLTNNQNAWNAVESTDEISPLISSVWLAECICVITNLTLH